MHMKRTTISATAAIATIAAASVAVAAPAVAAPTHHNFTLHRAARIAQRTLAWQYEQTPREFLGCHWDSRDAACTALIGPTILATPDGNGTFTLAPFPAVYSTTILIGQLGPCPIHRIGKATWVVSGTDTQGCSGPVQIVSPGNLTLSDQATNPSAI